MTRRAQLRKESVARLLATSQHRVGWVLGSSASGITPEIFVLHHHKRESGGCVMMATECTEAFSPISPRSSQTKKLCLFRSFTRVFAQAIQVQTRVGRLVTVIVITALSFAAQACSGYFLGSPQSLQISPLPLHLPQGQPLRPPDLRSPLHSGHVFMPFAW